MVERQQAALDQSEQSVKKLLRGRKLTDQDRRLLVSTVGLTEEEIEELHKTPFNADLREREQRHFAEPLAFFFAKTRGHGLLRIEVRTSGVTIISEDDERFTG